MKKNWDTTDLSFVAEVFSGFAFKSEDLVIESEQVPVLKIGQIQNKNVLKNVDDYYPKEKITERISRFFLQKEDTLIAMTGAGSVGKVGKMKKVDRPYLVNQRVAIVRVKDYRIDSRYMYYFLIQDFIENGLYDLGLGAGQPNISGTDIGKIKLHLPPLPIQKKIAAVLSAYDDLIETNERRIQILEKMAEELYKEWFVRLRFPGHETTKIVKGVPEDWEVKRAIDIFNILGGGTPNTDRPEYWDGDIPFFTPKDSHQGYYCMATEKGITPLGLENCNSKLYSKSTIFITARGTVGNISLPWKPMAMNQSCYALVPKENDNLYFHFLALKNSVDVIRGRSNSGVFDNIITDSFKVFGYFIPNDSTLKLFSNLIIPVFIQLENLLNANSLLKTSRDRLLSRLVSGKIDLSDLDIQFPPSMKVEMGNG